MLVNEVINMYENILCATTPAVASTCAAVVLPNTGVGSSVVTFAAAIAAGLAAWGITYAFVNR